MLLAVHHACGWCSKESRCGVLMQDRLIKTMDPMQQCTTNYWPPPSLTQVRYIELMGLIELIATPNPPPKQRTPTCICIVQRCVRTLLLPSSSTATKTPMTKTATNCTILRSTTGQQRSIKRPSDRGGSVGQRGIRRRAIARTDLRARGEPA